VDKLQSYFDACADQTKSGLDEPEVYSQPHHQGKTSSIKVKILFFVATIDGAIKRKHFK
jgi:hypothetical protein